MHNYRERDIPVPRVLAPVTVKYNIVPAPNWNPPIAGSITIPYKTPAYSRRFERFWQDDNRPFDWLPYNKNYRSQNKPCQHYTCELVDPALPDGTGSNRAITQWLTIPWAVDSATGIGQYRTGSLTGANPLLPVDTPSFRSQFGPYGTHYFGLPSMVTSLPDQRFIADPVGLNTLTRNSIRSLMPKILKQKDLSLVNSLIELKDFRSLPHTIRNLQHYADDLASLLGSLPKLAKLFASGAVWKPLKGNLRKIRASFAAHEGRTLREILRAPADAYLQEEFNIKPFFSDICGLWSALSDLEGLIKDLYLRQGRLQRRHYTYRWISPQFAGASQTLSYGLSLEQFAGYTTPAGFTGCSNGLRPTIRCTRYTVVDQPSIFHAEVEYRFILSQFQNEHARILGLLDRLGVNLNPSILWNAIPWSFVVDWVAGVSQWLDGRKILNLQPEVSIERYMWSYKSERRTRVSIDTGTSDLSNRITTYYLPDLHETIYRRDVVLPSFSDPLFVGSLDSKEVSLGVALAITRRRRSNLRLRG